MAIYRAEFVIVETPSEQQPHKKLSDTSTPSATTLSSGNGDALAAVASRILPKITTAIVASTIIKTGKFIYDSVATSQSNSALLAGDTVAYKHSQNQKTVIDNYIQIGSSIAMSALAGATVGSAILPGPGTAVGAIMGATVSALSQGVQHILQYSQIQEEKRVYEIKSNQNRFVYSMIKERYGVNEKVFR